MVGMEGLLRAQPDVGRIHAAAQTPANAAAGQWGCLAAALCAEKPPRAGWLWSQYLNLAFCIVVKIKKKPPCGSTVSLKFKYAHSFHGSSAPEAGLIVAAADRAGRAARPWGWFGQQPLQSPRELLGCSKLQGSIAIYRGKAESLLSSALALRMQAGTAG